MAYLTTAADLADVREIWAQVAEARLAKGDHEGAARARRAVQINQPHPTQPGSWSSRAAR